VLGSSDAYQDTGIEMMKGTLRKQDFGTSTARFGWSPRVGSTSCLLLGR
jgi:hypothetical protein